MARPYRVRFFQTDCFTPTVGADAIIRPSKSENLCNVRFFAPLRMTDFHKFVGGDDLGAPQTDSREGCPYDVQNNCPTRRSDSQRLPCQREGDRVSGGGILRPPKSDEISRTDGDVRPYARTKFTLFCVRFFGFASE